VVAEAIGSNIGTDPGIASRRSRRSRNRRTQHRIQHKGGQTTGFYISKITNSIDIVICMGRVD